MRTLRSASLLAMGLFFTTAGLFHFANPAFFVQIVPAWLPSPLGIVYLSGLAEIALGATLGAGLRYPALERAGAWGAIALLIAVYPANLNMWWNDIQIDGKPTPPYFHAVRLPLQFALIAWAYWHTRPRPALQPA